MPGHWRSLSGSSHDPEKQSLSSYPGTDDLDSSVCSHPSSSRTSSGSFAGGILKDELMPITHATRRFLSYQTHRKRFTRYFTLAISTSLILFIFFLIKASWISQAQVEAGVIDMPKATPEWEAFAELEKYFSGIRTLVDRSVNDVEYPVSEDVEAQRLEKIAMQRKVSEEFRDNVATGAQRKRDVASWQSRAATFDPFERTDQLESSPPVSCALDKDGKVHVPKLLAYKGVTSGFPNAVVGSYDVLGLRDDVCFERYGRYGPYGYGYSKTFGGSDAGMMGHTEGKEKVWDGKKEVDYREVSWADAQERCLQINEHRFQPYRVKEESTHWLSLAVTKSETSLGKRDGVFNDTGNASLAKGPDDKPAEKHDNKPAEKHDDKPAEKHDDKPAEKHDDKPAEKHDDKPEEKHDDKKDEPPHVAPTQHDLLPGELSDKEMSKGKRYLPRTAFIIRTWHDYEYDDEDLFNLRAMINELSIQSGGEYVVHFLVHVRNSSLQIWADESIYDFVLNQALPAEFRGMGTLWSEQQMALIYGGLEDSNYRGLPVHGVYRSTYMPLQYFTHMHPEYDYYWNWEMDVRYTGHFYHLLDKSSKWARHQPRKGLWERNGRFYVPAKHGSFEDFRQMVRVQLEHGTASKSNFYTNLFSDAKTPPPFENAPEFEKSVWGAVPPDFERNELDTSHDPVPVMGVEKDNYSWGVGEDADLITFSPIFDPSNTGWLLSDDVTGYNASHGQTPRRASIGTVTRLSRRLLKSMHRETAMHRRTMFSEMWPASCALHHGLKAVYVPHPVYVDRAWPTSYLAAVFNNGHNGASGGARTSIFNEDRRHNLEGVTWYYDSTFGTKLYRRWLGFKVNGTGGEEAEVYGEGRMCLPAMLLHPVKDMDLIVDGRGEEVDEPEPDDLTKNFKQWEAEGLHIDPEQAAKESAVLKDD